MPRKSTAAANSKCTPKCKRRLLLLIEIALYLIGIGLLIQIFFVSNTLTKTFDTEAAARLIISPSMQSQNSSTYQNWLSNTCQNLCAIQLFHYYLFNITNPSAVYNGAYPQLQELGPFVFNRYENRKDVQFSADGGSIVSYKYEYEFVLNEELTNMSLWNNQSWYDYQLHHTPSPTAEPTTDPTLSPTPSQPQSDVSPPQPAATRNPAELVPYPPIYVLNPFMLAAFAACKASGGGVVSICSGLGDASKLYFFNYTVQQILQTGMHSHTTALCNRNPLCNRTQKYIVDDDVYVTEHTGTDDMHKMRELVTFYGVNQTYGGGIDETTGEFYSWWAEPVYFAGNREPKQWAFGTLSANSVLNAWMMDKYRPVRLISDGFMSLSDLRLDRFIIDPMEYLSAANNSNNSKYYQLGYDGLLNLTTTNGANILQYTSKPYFLDAPYYAETLNKNMSLRAPNRSLDDTYFAIDATLGTVFQTQVTYQVSFGIEPCSDCGVIGSKPFRTLPNVTVPQFYVVVKGGAPPAAIEQYKQILALLDTTTQYSIYAAPAIALCCIVFALYLSGRRYCRYRRHSRFTLYMEHDDKSYVDDSIDKEHDNEVEFNAMESVLHDMKPHREDDINSSIGYAKRDGDDPMLMMSIDKTMNEERFNKSSVSDAFGSKSKLKRKKRDKTKAASASTKLLSKMSSTYSSRD